jgi:HSP20 family protein
LKEDLVKQIKDSSVFAQLQEMKQRMDQLFTESFESRKPRSDAAETSEHLDRWEPLMDIWESEGSWLLVMDLPGVADEDLQVEFAENKLTVKGVRKPMHGPEERKAAQIERPQGAFSRTFVLPGKIRQETIKAELRQGELTLLISKEPGPQAARQRVEVRSG